MASAQPWQTAEVAGPKKALVIPKPEVAAAMIKRASHPILIVGHNVVEIELEGKNLIEYFVDLAVKSKVPVVATAHIVGEFIKRGFDSAVSMSAMDIGSRLVDPEWSGIDGKGPHDLALFVGLPYYMEANILSGLKHFGPATTKTMTLDNMYHPHASWSFKNHNVKEWVENLKVLTSKFEEGEKCQRG